MIGWVTRQVHTAASGAVLSDKYDGRRAPLRLSTESESESRETCSPRPALPTDKGTSELLQGL